MKWIIGLLLNLTVVLWAQCPPPPNPVPPCDTSCFRCDTTTAPKGLNCEAWSRYYIQLTTGWLPGQRQCLYLVSVRVRRCSSPFIPCDSLVNSRCEVLIDWILPQEGTCLPPCGLPVTDAELQATLQQIEMSVVRYFLPMECRPNASRRYVWTIRPSCWRSTNQYPPDLGPFGGVGQSPDWYLVPCTYQACCASQYEVLRLPDGRVCMRIVCGPTQGIPGICCQDIPGAGGCLDACPPCGGP